MYILDNGEKYIGQTSNSLSRRHNNHKYGSKRSLIDRKLKTHNYTLEVIDELPIEELDFAEIYYIKHFNTLSPNGLNLTEGGGGTRGKSCSEETKKMISEANSGDNHWLRQPGAINPNFGKCFSEEVRKNMSDAHKGKPRSKEWSDKMSIRMSGEGNPNYGRVFDTDVRIHMSLSRKKYKVVQCDKDTGEELLGFYSMLAAEKVTGVSNASISACLRGRYETAGGYRWKRIMESD